MSFRLTLVVMVACLASPGQASPTIASPQHIREQVVEAARELLSDADVSYAMGGSRLGSEKECALCNACLESKLPAPKQRFSLCPECRACSLDCSHFTQLVFARGGIQHPYINTELMLTLAPERLRQNYGFIDMGTDPASLQAGDLVVYKGHVAVIERVYKAKVHNHGARVRADVIHATGGRDIKAAGQGIQRERLVDVSSFRGQLLKILRHERLR